MINFRQKYYSLFGSDKKTRVIEPKESFDKIKVLNCIELTVKFGNEFNIVLKGDKNQVDKTEVVCQLGTLTIKGPTGHALWNTTKSIKAEITLPKLLALTIEGASSGNLTLLKTQKDFYLDVSEASNFRGTINADNINITNMGASEIRIDLGCKNLRVSCSGSSEIRVTGKADKISGNCTGASSVKLNKTLYKECNVSCSGASEVR